MASYPTPEIVTFKADAAIAKGKACKVGTDSKHVAAGSANTSLSLGLAQNAATAAEDLVEVAVGGGAIGLAGESISGGNLLVSHTDGSLVKANSSGDIIVAMALEDASSGDLFAVLVVHGQAAAAV